MKNLVHEIHRRSLWQVLGIYLAAGWVTLQVVETRSESMSLPDWVQPFAVVLLLLGLPVVLATAFVQEVLRAVRRAMGGRRRGAPAACPGRAGPAGGDREGARMMGRTARFEEAGA